MDKLVCDFDSFEIHKNNLKNLCDNYNNLISEITGIETDLLFIWDSNSQKQYVKFFLERKKDLEYINSQYKDLISLLSEISNTYQTIEQKYS